MQTQTTQEAETYRYYVILMLLFVLLASCRKSDQNPPVPVPLPDLSDAKSIRLKELLVEKLPSPYFHFAYTNDGFADSISFANGFFTYKLHYIKKRVSRLVNTVDNSELLYQYNNEKVTEIVEYTGARKAIRRYLLSYNTKGQLAELMFWVIPVNGSEYVKERKVELEYHPDGNLSILTDYRYKAVNNEIAFSSTTKYTDYDDAINTDEFYLLKDSWAHLIYLPQVILQKNNPRLVVIKGNANDYKIDYTYEYNGTGLPTTKQVRMEQTRGENVGQVIKFASHFSYF